MRFPGISLRSGFSCLKPLATICLGVLSSASGLVAPRDLAKTTGDFIAARQLPLPGNLNPYYSGIAVGDVNGDHREDFVLSETVTDPVTAANTQVIQTLINNGDGTFKAVPALTDIHGQNVMALADLNSDGIQDLVCTFGYEDPNAFRNFLINVEVSFGHGDGTFAAPATTTIPAP
jgi:hypothetical protein